MTRDQINIITSYVILNIKLSNLVMDTNTYSGSDSDNYLVKIMTVMIKFWVQIKNPGEHESKRRQNFLEQENGMKTYIKPN